MKISKLIGIDRINEAAKSLSTDSLKRHFEGRRTGMSTGIALKMIGEAMSSQKQISQTFESHYVAKHRHAIVCKLIDQLNLLHLEVKREGKTVNVYYDILREVKPTTMWREAAV